ncbi:MAG: hypothetical protein AAGJ18_13435, partial [Bacteroidota bacterium]
ADETVFAETTVSVEQYVEPYVAFDDEQKYLSDSYEVGEFLEVTAQYHAGNGATVGDGIKFWKKRTWSPFF